MAVWRSVAWFTFLFALASGLAVDEGRFLDWQVVIVIIGQDFLERVW